VKVLMVVNQLQAGGAEVLAADLARGLAGLGVECALVALHASVADCQDLGIATTVLSGPVTASALPGAAVKLARLCLRERPDIVHSHGEAPDLLCRLVCPVLRLPHVVTLHTERPWHWRPKLGLAIERLGVGFTRQYVAVSDAVAQGMRQQLRIPAARMRWIANWACDPPGESTPTPQPPRGQPTLIHVARLHIQKGQDILLQAFEAVRQDWPGALLWIVGHGPEATRLQNLAGPGVVFLGHRQDVRQLLRRADLFVLSSHWEGLPLVLLEAMDEGVPVVSTQVGGIAELVEHNTTGLLVPPGDATALAQAILQSLEDAPQARARADKARRRCRDRRLHALQAHLRLYHEILGRAEGEEPTAAVIQRRAEPDAKASQKPSKP
jgi:glycosyltransferase involved in cell wall biosynthesis